MPLVLVNPKRCRRVFVEGKCGGAGRRDVQGDMPTGTLPGLNPTRADGETDELHPNKAKESSIEAIYPFVSYGRFEAARPLLRL